jgi:hypothetical protein
VLHHYQLIELYSIQQTLCTDKFSEYRKIREIRKVNFGTNTANENVRENRSKVGAL